MTAPPGWWRHVKTRDAVYAEVDRLLREGYTLAAVARELGVAESSIRRRRHATRGRRLGPVPGAPPSRRELQVLARLVAQDEPTHEVAALDLGMTVSGVEHSLTRLFAKLGVRSLLGAYRVVVVEQDRRLPRW